MIRRRAGWLCGALGGALVGVLAPGCRAPNPDHCLHKAAESDAWCQENAPDTPYCSPCAADNHGCVADPPIECPAYAPDTGDDPSGGGSEDASGSAG